MESIEFADLKNVNQDYRTELLKAAQEVIDSGQYINGPAVQEFEQNLADYLEIEHVVGCANGTDALALAFRALSLSPGDEVIIPAMTYVSPLEAAILQELKPVFVDIRPDSFLLDVDKLEDIITTNTKVIVPVHLFGQCVFTEKLKTIADDNDIYLVEDNAQALGAAFAVNGNKVKSGTLGTLATTSFFPTKILGGFGDGGAVYSKDKHLIEKIKKLKKHGQSEKYIYEMPGYNSRLDTLQAALLNVKLKRLEVEITERAKRAANYDMLMFDIGRAIPPSRVSNSTHVYHQYCIRVSAKRRDKIRQQLANLGIPTQVYYPKPLHLQPAYRHLGYKEGDFPVAEAISNQILALPLHSKLSFEDQEYIISVLKNLV